MFKSLDSIASVVRIFMYLTISKFKQVLRSRKGLDYNTAYHLGLGCVVDWQHQNTYACLSPTIPLLHTLFLNVALSSLTAPVIYIDHAASERFVSSWREYYPQKYRKFTLAPIQKELYMPTHIPKLWAIFAPWYYYYYQWELHSTVVFFQWRLPWSDLIYLHDVEKVMSFRVPSLWSNHR